jgi:predicted site-specific integrase-resolvase
MSSTAVAAKWLAYEDACERVGVTRSTADKWRRTGRCFPTKKLPNGSLRVREDLLAAWLDQLPEAS